MSERGKAPERLPNPEFVDETLSSGEKAWVLDKIELELRDPAIRERCGSCGGVGGSPSGEYQGTTLTPLVFLSFLVDDYSQDIIRHQKRIWQLLEKQPLCCKSCGAPTLIGTITKMMHSKPDEVRSLISDTNETGLPMLWPVG